MTSQLNQDKMTDLYAKITSTRPSGWKWLPECGAWSQTIESVLPPPSQEELEVRRAQAAEEAAQKKEAAKERRQLCDRAIELCDSGASADEIGEHLGTMFLKKLGGTFEFELGCAYMERVRNPEEYGKYIFIMPDFVAKHYAAGSPAARATLVAEAKARYEKFQKEADDLYSD